MHAPANQPEFKATVDPAIEELNRIVEQAESLLRSLGEQGGEAAEAVRERVTQTLNQAKARLAATAVEAEKVVESLADRADDYVRTQSLAGSGARRLVRRRGDVPARRRRCVVHDGTGRRARKASKRRRTTRARGPARELSLHLLRMLETRARRGRHRAAGRKSSRSAHAAATAAAGRRPRYSSPSGAASCCWPSCCRRNLRVPVLAGGGRGLFVIGAVWALLRGQSHGRPVARWVR